MVKCGSSFVLNRSKLTKITVQLGAVMSLPLSNKLSVKPVALIVDDEPDIAELLSLYAAKVGFAPIVAQNGKMGLDALSQHDVAVVISDLMMPEVSGMMLLSEMRSSGQHQPFIFVTAFPNQESSIKALKLGAFDFIEKPFEASQIKTVLEDALKASIVQKHMGRLLTGALTDAQPRYSNVALLKFSQEVRDFNPIELKQAALKEVKIEMNCIQRAIDGCLSDETRLWELTFIMKSCQKLKKICSEAGLSECEEKIEQLFEKTQQISKVSDDLSYEDWCEMRTLGQEISKLLYD